MAEAGGGTQRRVDLVALISAFAAVLSAAASIFTVWVAIKALNASTHQAELDQRAWIVPEGEPSVSEDAQRGTVRIDLPFSNTGKTPALETSAACYFFFVKPGTSLDALKVREEGEDRAHALERRSPVAPGKPFTIDYPYSGKEAELLSAGLDAGGQLIARTRIHYKDAFGKEHQTETTMSVVLDSGTSKLMRTDIPVGFAMD